MSRGLTDAEYTAQEERITRIAERWIPLLGLAEWEVKLDGDATGEMAAFYGESAGDTVIALMDCDCSWEYMRVTIRVNMIAAQETEDTELEEALVHELCHALVCELRPFELDSASHPHLRHEERVVTMLAKAFVRVRQNGVIR
jgi:hypothetical protein